MKTTRNPLLNRRGGAVLESAVAMIVLVTLSWGMIEFGQYMYAKNVVQSAARDGARSAILATASNAGVSNAIRTAMSAAGYGSSGYTYTVGDPMNGNAAIADVSTWPRGSGVTVTVKVNYGSVGVRPLGVISAAKQLVGAATMVHE